uniref:Chitin-binding type-2 domain-containing protein n=1 Tax=Anopheles atroparvus TaxID=41427 RepID=A0A182ILF8_ANOAO
MAKTTFARWALLVLLNSPSLVHHVQAEDDRCTSVPNLSYISSPNACYLYYSCIDGNAYPQWYYQCIDRIAYLLSCPLYYWFDEELQRCGTRFDVQCDREGSTTTMLPTPPTVDPLELCDDLPDFTLVPSASFCDRYYSCFQGNPYPQNCLPGLWFNPNTLECDDPDNVDCPALTERPPISTTTTSTGFGYRMARVDPARTSANHKAGVKTV